MRVASKNLKPKPCPFCGKQYKGKEMTMMGCASRFECPYCGAQGPFPLPKTLQAKFKPQEYYDNLTVAAWNQRAGK